MAPASPAPNYFVRLGKLSSQVQERALELSLIKASTARDATHKAVSQISSTLELLENLRGANTLTGAPEQLLKRWREWRQEGQREQVQGHGAESTEQDREEDREEDDKENREVQEILFITSFNTENNLWFNKHVALNHCFYYITHHPSLSALYLKRDKNFFFKSH